MAIKREASFTPRAKFNVVGDIRTRIPHVTSRKRASAPGKTKSTPRIRLGRRHGNQRHAGRTWKPKAERITPSTFYRRKMTTKSRMLQSGCLSQLYEYAQLSDSCVLRNKIQTVRQRKKGQTDATESTESTEQTEEPEINE